MSKKYKLLKTLTIRELKEICRRYGLRGYSKLRQKELAHFVAKSLDLSTEEIEKLVSSFWDDRLISKVKDAEDYFLMDNVEIEYFDEDFIKAQLGRHEVKIINLGKKDFRYYCDCDDYKYQVKRGKYPFCKHYSAVIAKLIYEGKLDVKKTQPNFISGKVLDSLEEIVENRRREDGIIMPLGRDIENSLKNIKKDLVEISKQNEELARKKYHEPPEKVFEYLVDQAFQLLEYETITQRREQGWDLLVIGTYAPKPYIAVVECKTAKSGIYDHLLHNPNYLIRLKNYCIEMCKEKLIGGFKDYVKYMVIVAPDFPEEIVKFQSQFKQMTGGIELSFLPAPTLLYMVEKYRENPILTHYISESIFKRGGIIKNDDVDKLFSKSEEHIQSIIEDVRDSLRYHMNEVCQRHTDACYIKIDDTFLKRIIDKIISTLDPYLLKQGKDGVTGMKTINIKHDYYKLWEKVLNAVIEDFTERLKEQSTLQIKKSDLKENIIKQLGI
ncbi:MAG TPA: hypothetical protein GXX31_00455 [Methanothermobacter sp.]|uniref:SWIM-type domain-containing protein n=1 Tax=Methanothermobacter tenebrarum TaxID=680118 RepID=A0ABN6PBG4_9EURY|nr:Rho termination factor N-terminal domain-containing protein [Methanothermobacter tenebrarum]MDX9693155.1 Rho termination factor N-terminal domain-containing protein [Methanothermobacter sp.]BDH79586.1 hypothetical protein MTTB_09650 [Methanothermobacter tenebrarum]HHW15848.1 hypothetical protein [Methanothermobacter sp.]